MAKMGIQCTFVEPDCTDEELERAFRPNTRAVFGETIANPALTVFDIERFSAAAHVARNYNGGGKNDRRQNDFPVVFHQQFSLRRMLTAPASVSGTVR